MENYKIPDWMLHNFQLWLLEFDNNRPYYTRLPDITFTELKNSYQLVLREACLVGSADRRALFLLNELAGLICSKVENLQFPACEVSYTLQEELRKMEKHNKV